MSALTWAETGPNQLESIRLTANSMVLEYPGGELVQTPPMGQVEQLISRILIWQAVTEGGPLTQDEITHNLKETDITQGVSRKAIYIKLRTAVSRGWLEPGQKDGRTKQFSLTETRAIYVEDMPAEPPKTPVAIPTKLPKAKPRQHAIAPNRKPKGIASSGKNSDDSVRQYLIDIGKHPLLTKDDEVRLAQAIEIGKDATAKLEAHKLAKANGERGLSSAEIVKLRRAMREGEDANKEFVESNLRLVVSIAKKYQKSGLPLLDLIQLGNLGLMHGVEKFEWRKGFKFSTYATWWIKQGITRGIVDTGRTIRIPVHTDDDIKAYLKAVDHIRVSTKTSDVSDEDVAEYTGWGLKHVKEIQQYDRIDSMTQLDATLSEDSDITYGDIIADRTSADSYEIADREMLIADFHEALANIDISPRDREILDLRYGLNSSGPKSFEAIGEMYGVTRERIRQITEKTVRMLGKHKYLLERYGGLLEN